MPFFLAVLIVFPVISREKFLVFLRDIATCWQRCVLRLACYGKSFWQ
jgi:hypothetical protein